MAVCGAVAWFTELVANDTLHISLTEYTKRCKELNLPTDAWSDVVEALSPPPQKNTAEI